MEMNDLELKKLSQGREYRNLVLQVRSLENEDDDYTVEGYATTFNQPYELYRFGDDYIVNEQVDRRAFENCDMSDVIFQYNHEGRVYARTRNGTLKLESDLHGLKVIANLGGTEEGKKLYEEIKGGYTDRMSFGFIVKSQEVLRKEEGDTVIVTRTITEISKLYDVSAVSIPANDMTEISARDYANGVIDVIKSERAKEQELMLAKAKAKAKQKNWRY